MSHTIRVLMVDDEEQFRATAKKILNRRGFEVLLAGSGEEALEKLEESPDVVVLDVKMPGMDGHQALKEIRKVAPRMPIIMLTGHGALPSAEEALEEGAFDYLAKPCDMDLLAAKITDAHELRHKDGEPAEKRVRDVMIPIADYTTVQADQDVGEALKRLKESFESKREAGQAMETGHRSILVFDGRGRMQGILAIVDLIGAVMPAYLTAPKPSTAESIQYSPMFWHGMFTREVRQMAKRKIKEIMSPAPLTVEGKANLMEAAFKMHSERVRRLAVIEDGEVIGIIREQDLFFEMNRILKNA